MIIKRLTLHNFGVYASTNTFEFTGNKPVVLIGGLNGRGKTTFLEAVLLSLYGANSFAYKESAFNTYGQYLRSYVNKSDGTLQAYVELEFQLNNASKDRYIVHREWDSKSKKKTVETINVKKNGEESTFLTQNWQMFIENMLPSALSNFFFFDGEKIAELAVDDTSTKLKESIRSMLGISVLDTLKSDLNRNIKKISRIGEEAITTEKVDALRQAKNDAEEKLAAIDADIERNQNRLNDIGQEIEQKKIEYSAKGGDVAEKKEELLSDKAKLEARIQQNNEKLLSLASGELPLSLVHDLLKSIAIEGEKERKAVIAKQATEQINALYKKYSSEVGDDGAAQKFLKFVNRETSQSKAEEVFYLSEQTLYQANLLSTSKIKETIDDAIKAIEQQKKLEAQADEIDNYLSIDINEEELKRIYREIRELEEKQTDYEVKLSALNKKRSSANGDVIKATSEFNKGVTTLLNQMEASDDANRDLKYTEMAIHVLDEYSIRLQQKKTGLLGQTITECYKKLADKKNLIDTIVMDPVTLDLTYWDKDQQRVEKTALSAGEKQLVVISILWALAICSKKKLPVIIDTPLSRLDSNHRKALIQIYFPQASEQTIILSTDTEIDQKYYELMKENVGDEFTLEYNDDTRSTSIQRGYFTGVLK